MRGTTCSWFPRAAGCCSLFFFIVSSF
uniref:Uncharacterized protein n=1 Tax=Arundo donax TaxID=35708 RepID=A0A0A9B3D5_ARUDO